jgi:uncharacterized membrane protein
MDTSKIKKKITGIGSKINISSIEKSIENEADKIMKETTKEMSEIADSKVGKKIEKIFDKIAKITKSIFAYVLKYGTKIWNLYIDIILSAFSSSVCCMCLPFILLGIILSMIITMVEATGDDNGSETNISDTSGAVLL